METIKKMAMVDLVSQHHKIQGEIDQAITNQRDSSTLDNEMNSKEEEEQRQGGID